MDYYLDQFLRDLDYRNLGTGTNLVIMTDHGMTSITDKTRSNLAKYTDVTKLEKVVDRTAWTLIKAIS